MLFHIHQDLWRSRYLLWQLTKREITARYRGSILGAAWSVINPLMMLLVYTFVFSVVFNARWGISPNESRTDFALILFSGLTVHNFFAESVNRAPTLIPTNINFVKKIVFPLEVLPICSSAAAFFNCLIGIGILLLSMLMLSGSIPWTALAIPLVLIPFFIACVGVSYILSILGVYVRDIVHITGFVTTIALFVSPVFYPVSAVPPTFRIFIALNPLTYVFETVRGLLVLGVFPSLVSLIMFWICCLLIGAFGLWWFTRTKRGFADVL